MRMKYIDLQEIAKERDNKALKRMPRFVMKLLEKIICQDKMNGILTRYEGLEGAEFNRRIAEDLNIRFAVEGRENLPDQCNCFLVANHPFGVADGLAITSVAAEKYGRFKSIGNDVYFYIPNLKNNIVAVNVFGKSPRMYIEKALEELRQTDCPVTHFPAGLVSRLRGFRVMDREWQKSLITRAVSTKRMIVPIYFYGRNSLLFYTIFLLRKMLFIPLNLELALLPYEFFRKRNKTIRMKIGPPIPWERFDRSMSHYCWAQKVREYVYQMGRTKGNPPPF